MNLNEAEKEGFSPPHRPLNTLSTTCSSAPRPPTTILSSNSSPTPSQSFLEILKSQNGSKYILGIMSLGFVILGWASTAFLIEVLAATQPFIFC
jgi:hypothetical protein